MYSTKKQAKKNILQNIVFRNKVISRQDLIQQSGLNERTVIKYADEFCKKNIIYSKVDVIPRGRPSVYYYTNCDQFIFIGVVYHYDQLIISAVNINGVPLHLYREYLKNSITHNQLYRMIFEEIENIIKKFSSYTLMGISCSTEYIKIKLHDFENIAAKRYDVNISMQDTHQAILQHYANYVARLEGRIGGIYASIQDYGIVLLDNHEIVDCSDVKESLNHLNLFPDSPIRCTCRKTGCLSANLTRRGTAARYCKLFSPPLTQQARMYDDILALAIDKKPESVEVLQQNAKVYVELALKLQKDLNLDHVVMINQLAPMVQMIKDYMKKINTTIDICFCGHTFSNVAFYALDNMRQKFINIKY